MGYDYLFIADYINSNQQVNFLKSCGALNSRKRQKVFEFDGETAKKV